MTFYLEMIKLGVSNLRKHTLRSVLTALGIILGVSAVIVVVAVGEGDKREALAQIERLGAKNIILRSAQPAQNASAQQSQGNNWITRFGLTETDLLRLQENLPNAEAIVPLKDVGSQILRNERIQTSQTIGTTPVYQDVAKVRVARGRYLTDEDMRSRAMVAVIGPQVADQLFPLEDPLDQNLRIDDQILRVVGILEPIGLAAGRGAALVGRDMNKDVHIPLSTARSVFGDVVVRRSSGSTQAQEVQFAEIYISVPTRSQVASYAEVIQRLIDIDHRNEQDVQRHVPFELLEEARRSALRKNLVVGAIAGISLLVGGIGIMNIMLASVTERTREIGIRRALGATRRHIKFQFLIETGMLSLIGGLIGVATGVTISWGLDAVVPVLYELPWVGRFFSEEWNLPTYVTAWSIGVSLGVAALTGLVFGIYPAIKAAQQDPIVALRHD